MPFVIKKLGFVLFGCLIAFACAEAVLRLQDPDRIRYEYDPRTGLQVLLPEREGTFDAPAYRM